MTAAGHTWPNFTQIMTGATGFTALASSTKLVAGLVHVGSTFNWVASSQAYATVADFLTNAGASAGGLLTEEAGSGYSRQVLTSVTCTTSGLVTTLSCAPLVWTTSTISSVYLFVYDKTTDTNDTTRKLLCYQDFGGTETDTAGTFTFTPNAAGIATWTAS